MKSTQIIVIIVACLLYVTAAQRVVGSAQGFATGVTGGGNAKPEHPQDVKELLKMLTDKTPRVIVLSKEYDFTGSEGKTTGTVCASWGDGPGCQKIIQKDCGTKPKLTGTWDNAARIPISVASNKSLIGVGNKGVIKGKGLRMGKGSSNVIIQNIEVKDLNHQYVWGGDAISFDGADHVWVDHVTVCKAD
jgi:pectin lyase